MDACYEVTYFMAVVYITSQYFSLLVKVLCAKVASMTLFEAF